MQYLWFDQDIKQAVDFSRFHHQLIPMEIQYEYGNLDVLMNLMIQDYSNMYYNIALFFFPL